MRRSSSARQSGVIGEGLNISLLALFQQYLHLLLGLLQGLLAMTGQRNTAFDITQRLLRLRPATLAHRLFTVNVGPVGKGEAGRQINFADRPIPRGAARTAAHTARSNYRLSWYR